MPTTIVYVFAVPGTATVFPSVFVIDRSPRRATVFVSAAELLLGFKSGVVDVTTAVLVTEPADAPCGTVYDTVSVAVPPEANPPIVQSKLPEEPGVTLPAEGCPKEPCVNAAGHASDTLTPVAGSGPWFCTVSV